MMTGLIKMYCYKMFRQKSLYVIWGIIAVMMLLNLTMIPERTFSALLCKSGSLTLIFPSLFTAMFFRNDHASGFIKNYAGSVADRSIIIAARAVIIFINNIFSWGVIAVSGLIFTHHTGSINVAVMYGICMFLAGLGCSFAAMLITELFRKTVPVIILTLVTGSGILCELIAAIIALITNGNVIVKSYFLTGMFNIFGETQMQSDAVKVICISIIYIIVSLLASNVSIKKRDVV